MSDAAATVVLALTIADESTENDIRSGCIPENERRWRIAANETPGSRKWLERAATYLVMRGLATRDGDVITLTGDNDAHR